MSRATPAQITVATAGCLGPAPATRAARRAQAHPQLADGTATLAAVARAWYGGDTQAAKRDLYGRRVARSGGATAALEAAEPGMAWDGS